LANKSNFHLFCFIFIFVFFQFACIDNTGQYLVVAGQHGFVHFSLFTRKWKLFGNAGQVKILEKILLFFNKNIFL